MSRSADESWTIKQLLTEVVGSGPRSAEDMSRAQAEAACHEILADTVNPTTLGAFLLANRWKGNTPTELAGFLDTMQLESVDTITPTVDVLDCGANYDGKTNSALLGVGAGLVAAASGAPVVVHSSDRMPASYGDTYKHVLDELDIPTEISPETSVSMVEEVGFGFYYQPRFNPGIHGLQDRREHLGVRSFFNTIETLANPAGASTHLGSFYHLTFAKKTIETVQESEHTEFDRVVMIQGMEGYDDIRPGNTKVAVGEDGDIQSFDINAGTFDFEFSAEDLAVSAVARESARITKEVLEGRRQDHFADAIALNGAIRLFAHGAVETLDDAVERARASINEGKAAERLKALQTFSERETDTTT